MNTSHAVTLEIKGLGEIPSFKNSKVLARGRMFTKPAYQKTMERITRSFEFQLKSALQTTGTGTPMEPYQPCSIVSLGQLVPLDDSRQWIPEIHVKAVKVSKGQEGAVIMIERIE